MTSGSNPLERLPEFFSQVRARLLAGRREYQDRSFSREPRELLDEISQELLDTAAWSFILFERLAAARQALRFAEIQSDVIEPEQLL